MEDTRSSLTPGPIMLANILMQFEYINMMYTKCAVSVYIYPSTRMWSLVHVFI